MRLLCAALFLFTVWRVCIPADLGICQSGRFRNESAAATEAARPTDDGAAVALETSEVIVPVTVRDRQGRLIPNLSRADFTVYENGRRQEITAFSADPLPVSVVLLIDASGSVQTETNDIRQSALSFINAMGNDDQACVMRFNDRVELVEDWTNAKLRLQRALLQMPATGNTKFYNALADAARKLATRPGRRVIILFTDGVDTYAGQDRKSPEEALEAVFGAEVTVYIVSKTRAVREVIKGARAPRILRPVDPADPVLKASMKSLDEAEAWLLRLSERTGGAIFFPLEQSDLKDAYGQIADELNRQYILRYYARNPVRDGGFRRIRVSTGNPDYQAIAREGYYATPGGRGDTGRRRHGDGGTEGRRDGGTEDRRKSPS